MERPLIQAGDKFLVRLPEGMRERIAEAARANQRTMTREIAARLQSTFEAAPLLLSHTVQQAVDHMVEEAGCTPAEALDRLVLAGQAHGGKVLNVRIAPNTTVAQVKAMLEEASKYVPPDANLVVERE